jgi:hypothetical protein
MGLKNKIRCGRYFFGQLRMVASEAGEGVVAAGFSDEALS